MTRCGWVIVLCALLPMLLASEGESNALWSGSIDVEEFIFRPTPSEGDEALLNDLAAVLAERIAQRQEQRDAALEPERRLIEQDIIALEADRRQIQQALGGRQELSRTRFVLRDAPLAVAADRGQAGTLARADVGGGVLVANWAEGLLRGRDRWQRFEGALPLSSVAPLPLSEEAGPEWAAQATRRIQLESADGVWEVDYVPGLPNPWAHLVTTDLDAESYPVQFARIPGLPVRCHRPLRGGGSLRIEVVAIDVYRPADELFANP